MRRPKYIAVVNEKGERGSHMQLGGDSYSTYGWRLPLSYVKWNKVKKCYIISCFMEHLDGNKLEPISYGIFKRGVWGIKSKV